MNEWFLAEDIAGLPDIPTLPNNVTRRATKELWKKRQVKGAKGVTYEYHITSLPPETQKALRTKLLQLAPPELAKGELSLRRQEIALDRVSDKQLSVADNRILVVRWYLQKELELGLSRTKTLDRVIGAIGERVVPDVVLSAIAVANGKSGGKIKLSKRTLHSWVLAYEAGENSAEQLKQMIPLKMEKRTSPEKLGWLQAFLGFYQTFSNVALTQAYAQFAMQYVGEDLPTERQVRYALSQLPDYVLQQGRKTGAEMRNLTPFVRRDSQVMEINECWVGDGHSFKGYVKRRENGMPYVPEVTAIIDVRTHLVVGWSIADSESVIAVGDALRHGILTHGCPNIYYSDNGRGQSNKMFDTDITGILPRLGIHHETGIAGNPQGRGIIERLWKSTLIPLAKTYQSYNGKDGDSATKHWNYRKIQSAIKAKAKDKLLTDEQKKAMAWCPEFADFVADVTACFEEYNNRPHRSLPRNPQTGLRFSPAEFKAHLMSLQNWQPNVVTAEEAQLLFRPEVERVAQRGEVFFDNKIYFHIELADFNGEKVRVCYDLHDPSTVIVKQMSGEVICEAILDGNKTDYMPESARESGRRKSLEAKIRRKREQADILEAQHRDAIELKADMSEVFGGRLMRTKQKKKTYALFEAEYEELEEKVG
ncbi:hypothetical protein BMT54_01210 [Pasteurellaceae bacterium 15-036681]|nr:hypothetical protein BMT54_01210 [Pasteurellaceae bacterium 15-036681]